MDLSLLVVATPAVSTFAEFGRISETYYHVSLCSATRGRMEEWNFVHYFTNDVDDESIRTIYYS